jgi:hypothetical protein
MNQESLRLLIQRKIHLLGSRREVGGTGSMARALVMLDRGSTSISHARTASFPVEEPTPLVLVSRHAGEVLEMRAVYRAQ